MLLVLSSVLSVTLGCPELSKDVRPPGLCLHLQGRVTSTSGMPPAPTTPLPTAIPLPAGNAPPPCRAWTWHPCRPESAPGTMGPGPQSTERWKPQGGLLKIEEAKVSGRCQRCPAWEAAGARGGPCPICPCEGAEGTSSFCSPGLGLCHGPCSPMWHRCGLGPCHGQAELPPQTRRSASCRCVCLAPRNLGSFRFQASSVQVPRRCWEDHCLCPGSLRQECGMGGVVSRGAVHCFYTLKLWTFLEAALPFSHGQ